MLRPILNFCFVSFLIFSSIDGFASDDPNVIADLFSEKADAVVMIAVESKDGDKLGSGFFISRDGKIVTNYHLISGARKVVVKLKNNSVYVPRRVVNLDPDKDIAVIQIDAPKTTYLQMGDSNSVVVGQRVLTIGNPLGLESSVSDGLISSVRVTGQGLKIFQISVPLSNGSSGGPLMDLDGNAVGITTASLAKGQNLNFAVPINYVKMLLKKPFDPSRFARQSWQSEGAVRTKRSSENPSRPPHDYVVKEGDTLYGLARKFQTSVKECVRINHLKDSKIYPGQRLLIPY